MSREKKLQELEKLLKSRDIPRNMPVKEKACIVFLEHNKEKKFSIRMICDYLHIHRRQFKNFVWRKINGYPVNEETRLNYLNEAEEDLLKQKIICMNNENKSMTKDEVLNESFKIKQIRVKETQEIFLRYFPDDRFEEVNVPSLGWLEGFNERNNLVKKKEELLENVRHQNGTSSTIIDYFKILENEFPEIKNYNPKLIGNFDETMLELRNKKEICIVEKKNVQLKNNRT